MTTKPTPQDIHLAGVSIKSMALDQMCQGLINFGVPEADVAKARAEAERTNSDKPLMALMPFKKLGF